MIGPNGEKRPGNGESKRPGGQKGGRARADALTPEQRRQIAKEAPKAR